MLKNISVDKLQVALKKEYGYLPEEAIVNKANKFIANTDERLEKFVLAYLENGNEEEYEYGEYSLMLIESLQKVGYLEAIEMLSNYMASPEEGANAILRPTFGKRF